LKTLAIVQARMGSSRLKGKVIEDICGKTMLERVVGRLQKCYEIDEVVVATSTHPNDDVIEKLCTHLKIGTFRGSEDDVLSRFVGAAQTFGGDIIVRVCSDSPLVDPTVSGQVIAAFKKRLPTVDYAGNHLPLTYPLGLNTEVFTKEALDKTASLAKLAYERAHVTIFMIEHPELFRVMNVPHSENFGYHRWTVDTPEDLEFMRQVYKRLARAGDSFSWTDVLTLLSDEPELMKINEGIEQKEVTLG